MTEDPDFSCFRRLDASRNMARYYTLSLQPTLFGDMALVRCWGRLGTRGQSRSDLFDSVEAAEKAFDKQKARRIRRGYRPV